MDKQPLYRQQEVRSREPTVREQLLYKLFGDNRAGWEWADKRGIGSNPALGQDMVPRGALDPTPEGGQRLTQEIINNAPAMALTMRTTGRALGSRNIAERIEALFRKHGGNIAAAKAELADDVARASQSAMPWDAEMAKASQEMLDLIQQGERAALARKLAGQ